MHTCKGDGHPAGEFDFVVFPYRDLYFAQRYGWAVRDLAMIRALMDSPRVRALHVVGRPVSLYERVINKPKRALAELGPTGKAVDVTSFDLIGPLRGRGWARSAYSKIVSTLPRTVGRAGESKRIVLDFTPIANINYSALDPHAVWYDQIDNFTKHNRFSGRERRLVSEKYNFVSERADLVTSVSDQALTVFGKEGGIALANGIFEARNERQPSFPSDSEFDLGFMGFITSKFDVELVRLLAEEGGLRVVIYGDVYDNKIARDLRRVSNLSLAGAFNAKETDRILETFSVGLIPYREDLSHDGSPLKLYQYLAAGRQVISSHAFKGETDLYPDSVRVMAPLSSDKRVALAREMVARARSGGWQLRSEISGSVGREVYWSTKLDSVLDKLSASISRGPASAN